jgi:hypothetical protein
VNHVRFTDPTFGQIVVEDTTAPVVAGAGCVAEPGGHRAHCDVTFKDASGGNVFSASLRDRDDTAEVALQGIGNLQVDGGSGDDHLAGGPEGDTLYGGAGRDTIVGGAASDSINGGGGSDHIDVGNDPQTPAIRGNDWMDDVDCRAPSKRSHDTVIADASDNVAPGCRVVGNPHSHVNTVSIDSDWIDVAGSEFEIDYGASYVVVGGPVPQRFVGRVGFFGSCVLRSTCQGRLILRLAGHGPVIGSGSYRMKPHRRTAASARLNSRGLAQLRKHRSVAAEIYVDPVGAPLTFGDELTLRRA